MALNSTIQTVGVPSSSGYPVYSALTNIVYAQQFVARFYAETITGFITDTGVVPAELKAGGDLAILYRAPVGELKTYTKNQALEVSSLNVASITFKVDKAFYWNFKLDLVDKTQVGAKLASWLKEFQDNSMHQLAALVEHGIIQDMVQHAHGCNKGSTAGIRSRSYNLGRVGAPLPLAATTAINPLVLTAVLNAVLTEQNIPQGKRFVVWPSMAQPLFLASPLLANAYQSGLNQSALISGEVSMIQRAQHFFSTNTPTYNDTVAGVTAYPVVMGTKDATGFINQLSQTEIIDKDPQSFSHYWRGLQTFGWGVIRPEALAVAYVSISAMY